MPQEPEVWDWRFIAGHPPTPGQSIVRRPDNDDMFYHGQCAQRQGLRLSLYLAAVIRSSMYGQVLQQQQLYRTDKRDIPDSFVHHITTQGYR